VLNGAQPERTLLESVFNALLTAESSSSGRGATVEVSARFLYYVLITSTLEYEERPVIGRLVYFPHRRDNTHIHGPAPDLVLGVLINRSELPQSPLLSSGETGAKICMPNRVRTSITPY